MPKPTFQDIADLAGVSTATVCRVIHGKETVASGTRTKVLTAMRDLGVPRQDTTLIGLIVPDSSNPYFSNLCFKFEQTLENMNAHVLISSSEGRVDREVQLIRRFHDLGVKGVVYTSTGQGSEGILNLIAEGFPVLAFDRRIPAGNVDTVTVNSRHGTLSAVDYLIVRNHKKIGYLKGIEGTETARERFESFQMAMNQNRLELVPEWIFDGDYTLSAGRACAERLLSMPEDSRPTAVLAANDLMALGLMQRLQQAGWLLPQQLSVIGFDNIPWGEWTYPSLTTIAQPICQLVREASSRLMRRIAEFEEDPDSRRQPESVEIKPKLIPRESVSEPWEKTSKPNLTLAD